jgi:hypothetical protein
MVLFFAASRVTSIYDACRRLARAPSDQAVRDAAGDMLPRTMPALERRLNDALAERVPKGLFAKARPVAIDLHQDPYYGKPHKRQKELRRGKRERGTSRFHCYATLCTLRRGQRYTLYTLAATYVWKTDSYERVVRRVVRRLPGRARALGLRVRYLHLLLDRALPGVLQRGGGPAPAVRPVPVPHARRPPRPPPQGQDGRADEEAEGHPPVPLLAAERVQPAHDGQPQGPDDGEDRRRLPGGGGPLRQGASEGPDGVRVLGVPPPPPRRGPATTTAAGSGSSPATGR